MYKIVVEDGIITISYKEVSVTSKLNDKKTIKQLLLEFHDYVKLWRDYYGEEMEDQNNSEFGGG